MERRDGAGDLQAPPRPPKLLPRVHRPRAPEPPTTTTTSTTISTTATSTATATFDMLNATTNRRRKSQEDLTDSATAANKTENQTQQTLNEQPKTEFQRILRMIGKADDLTNKDSVESTTTIVGRNVNSSSSNTTTPQGANRTTTTTAAAATTQNQQLNSITTTATSSQTGSTRTTATKTTTTATAVDANSSTDLLVHGICNRSPTISTNSSCSSSANRSNRSRSQTHNPNINRNHHNINFNNNLNNSSLGLNNGTTSTTNNTFIINSSQEDSFLGTHPDYDNYQIHHLTYLPQRPSSLSRNSSHVSTSSSSSITAANSFTRRRLPPTPSASASVPLLTISGTNGGGSGGSGQGTGGSFFSHFHSAAETTSAAAQTVTLAQPRPECQRHSNEYVDTPLRNTATATAHAHLHHQQLQHATRNQHPAGQQDNGPTTTHHVLLLPQRGLRTPHPASAAASGGIVGGVSNNIPNAAAVAGSSIGSSNQQLHSNRTDAVFTAGSANNAAAPRVTTIGSPRGQDRTDGFIHSQPHKSTTTASSLSSTPSSPSTPVLAASAAQPNKANIEPIITKQPASSNFKPGQERELLHDIHNHHHHLHHSSSSEIASAGIGGIAAINNNSSGIPIISTGHISPNSITCPHCGMCRCEQCQAPRLLPERWLCNKTCLCSAETVIDYASCLCCAKAFFYHCARDSDMDYDDGTGTSYLENPCSCGPYKRAERLGWLGALSLVLPCLWCYWPMRGCAKLGQLCYGYVAGRGCRCTQPGSPVHMLSVMSQQRSANNGNGGSGSGSGNGSGVNSNGTSPTMANNNRATVGGDLHANENSKSTDNDDDGIDGKNHHHYHLHHHHHHLNEDDSKASQMLCEPEKRLLDSTHEF